MKSPEESLRTARPDEEFKDEGADTTVGGVPTVHDRRVTSLAEGGRGSGMMGRIPYEVRPQTDPLVLAWRYLELSPGHDYSREDVIARLGDARIRRGLPPVLFATLCAHLGIGVDYFDICKRRGRYTSTCAQADELVLVRAKLYTREALAATVATLPVRPRSPKPGEGIKN